MNVKKIIGLLVLAFVIFYVVAFPIESSQVVRSGIAALGDAAESVATFVRSVFA